MSGRKSTLVSSYQGLWCLHSPRIQSEIPTNCGFGPWSAGHNLQIQHSNGACISRLCLRCARTSGAFNLFHSVIRAIDVSWLGARWQGPSWNRPCCTGSGSNKRKVQQVLWALPKRRRNTQPHSRRKLEEFQNTVNLPIWKNYAPDDFMEEMRHMCARIDALTRNSIETFITGECKALFSSLDHLDCNLLRIPPPLGSQPSVVADSLLNA